MLLWAVHVHPHRASWKVRNGNEGYLEFMRLLYCSCHWAKSMRIFFIKSFPWTIAQICGRVGYSSYCIRKVSCVLWLWREPFQPDQNYDKKIRAHKMHDIQFKLMSIIVCRRSIVAVWLASMILRNVLLKLRIVPVFMVRMNWNVVKVS